MQPLGGGLQQIDLVGGQHVAGLFVPIRPLNAALVAGRRIDQALFDHPLAPVRTRGQAVALHQLPPLLPELPKPPREVDTLPPLTVDLVTVPPLRVMPPRLYVVPVGGA